MVGDERAVLSAGVVGADLLQKFDADFDAQLARMQSAAHARAVGRIAAAPVTPPARKSRAAKSRA